ncbi:hypothetical protein GCM10009127_06220 [Alteraurantiacibacter aestuarii]|uniref:Alpha/beta hydrolase n=1 Tax=Alteraurantiacibacter aestuarii TaxID=650004 RepID=A0A844ZPW8_9SPHN|nr:alpha/beta hydrolase [Alteraurantiacibacter aestuarii]MXO89100.1 alpha/beta hydrolase [Alteraurantiacibacter aestuarii]
MRILVTILVSLSALLALPAAAQTYVYEEVVEQWVETGASRFVSPQLAHAEQNAIAAYGPFRVLDNGRAALVGVTDSYSPAEFDRMLADYPGIDTLEFIECPGTHDDRANLRLGRMIRARGIAAVAPEGGSVRSGAVELFLAGSTRRIADGAEFAVHAWLDEYGQGAWDYAPGSPEHLKYLSYYREMGMDAQEAARFYAMTNSVPFESAMWMSGAEMRGWIETDRTTDRVSGRVEERRADSAAELPRLAYLDLAGALN